MRDSRLAVLFVVSDLDLGVNYRYGSWVSRTFNKRTKTGAKMKRRNLLRGRAFIAGELYLFHHADPSCPACGSLWGIVSEHKGGIIFLESSSRDLLRFRLWHVLPAGFRYCRRAGRAELRDYVFNLACFECGNESLHG